MYARSTIGKIIATFSETTQIPILYIDNAGPESATTSQNCDYQAIQEFADFCEVVEYVYHYINQETGNQNILRTFYTRNSLAYITLITCNNRNNKGAFIAGPLLPYQPDQRALDVMPHAKTLPLHKKTRFENYLKMLPMVSTERLNHLGQLLYVLTASNEKSWYTPIPQSSVSGRPSSSSAYKGLMDIDANMPENDLESSYYSFCLKLKSKIIQGNSEGIIDLLNDNADLFWDTKIPDDNYRYLKNKCLVIISTAGVFAIQGNSPYKRVIGLIVNFATQINNLKSPHEVILKTAHALESFAYLVSISSSAVFSLHIKRVLQYIKEHYKEKITLEKLAQYVGLNAAYLSGLIKKETNLSLLDNINLVRVEEGKNLLIFTNKTVHEISYILGYNYQNHFNNVFKKFTNMTPLEFRNNFGRNSHDL